ncbi:hypothetical protein D3C83_87840 [compost metagenome]
MAQPTAYSATALLLPPGTFATAMPDFFIETSSIRSTPAPVTCTSLTLLFSNSGPGSLPPTAGITSARESLMSAASCGSSGLR